MSDAPFTPPPTLGEPDPGRDRASAPRDRASGRPGAPRPPRRRRRGALIAWVVGGAAALAIVGGVIADVMLTQSSQAISPVDRGATGDLAGIRVVAGLCLEAPVDDAATVGTVRAVACGEPHRAETVAQLSFDGDEWPGASVGVDALAFCADRVARIVPPDAVTGLEWRVWAPSMATWEAGDRTAVCVVSSPVALTGSIEAGTAAPA